MKTPDGMKIEDLNQPNPSASPHLDATRKLLEITRAKCAARLAGKDGPEGGIDGFDELTLRIELAAAWAKVNGPLEQDEAATVMRMLEAQLVRAIARGDFEPRIHRSRAEAFGAFLQRRA
jgi:hypothetical protein